MLCSVLLCYLRWSFWLMFYFSAPQVFVSSFKISSSWKRDCRLVKKPRALLFCPALSDDLPNWYSISQLQELSFFLQDRILYDSDLSIKKQTECNALLLCFGLFFQTLLVKRRLLLILIFFCSVKILLRVRRKGLERGLGGFNWNEEFRRSRGDRGIWKIPISC